MRRWLVIGAWLGAVTLGAAPAQRANTQQVTAQQPRTQQAKAARASAANGKTVYMRVGCYTCHGTVGQGGAGKTLAPNTIALDAFKSWVRNGTPGWTIASGMPAFPAKVLTDAELEDVHAYLASVPVPPAPNDIPLLDELGAE